jgi:hypothetical protein
VPVSLGGPRMPRKGFRGMRMPGEDPRPPAEANREECVHMNVYAVQGVH